MHDTSCSLNSLAIYKVTGFGSINTYCSSLLLCLLPNSYMHTLSISPHIVLPKISFRKSSTLFVFDSCPYCLSGSTCSDKRYCNFLNLKRISAHAASLWKGPFSICPYKDLSGLNETVLRSSIAPTAICVVRCEFVRYQHLDTQIIVENVFKVTENRDGHLSTGTRSYTIHIVYVFFFA